jgi:Na+-translocating ferredoxin:NAD+ oxidoreductase RnfD subunit
MPHQFRTFAAPMSTPIAATTHADVQQHPAASPSPSPSGGPSQIVHSGGTVERYYAQHFQGAVFPLAAGLLLYGWRSLIVVAVVMASAAAAAAVWRRVGRRGRDLAPSHAAWLALLLSLTLPAHLGSLQGMPGARASFWLLPAAGVLLVIVLWLLRGVAGTAVHPVLATYLILVPVFQELLVPRVVLERDKLFLGDVLDAPADAIPHGTSPWWLTRGPAGDHDAIRVGAPASESLLAYTLGRRELPDRGAILLTGLLRDRLPPLEDLVMAGNPGPIGTSSVIFVVVGGLFLMYRGVIDYRIPLLIVLAAFVTLLVLPIPIAITDGGPRWSWLAAREPSVGWAVGVTFVNYQLAASPLLFTAFFLATSPTVRPITRRGRTAFAMTTGCLSAVMQLYVSVSWGPYVALLIACVLTPLADRFLQPRPLA